MSPQHHYPLITRQLGHVDGRKEDAQLTARYEQVRANRIAPYGPISIGALHARSGDRLWVSVARSSNVMAAFDAVVFDLFHTLVDTEPVRPAGYDPVSRIAGSLSANLEHFARFWAATYLERETTQIDVVDLVDRYARSAGGPLTPPQRSEVDQILGRYRDLAVLNPQPEAIELIERLSRRARLGLLTNCYEREVRRWVDSPLAQLFYAVVFSFEIGALKPDRSTYRAVLAALNVEAGAAAFVGNGLGGTRRGPSRRVRADCPLKHLRPVERARH